MKIAYNPLIPLIESHVAIYKIYVLRNPLKDNEIFYVGQTFMSLENRLSGHLSGTGSNREKINYIKEIVDAGSRPIIESIEVIRGTCYIDKMMVNEREFYWIRYYLTIGCKLLNVAGISNSAKCHEYHGYLSSLKRGETSYHYYYCGKTAGGYEVYDEEKLKMDGFILKEPPPKVIEEDKRYDRVESNYSPFEYNKYRLRVGIPVIERPDYWKGVVRTETFPQQPDWSYEFSSGIPEYKSLKVWLALEMQVDNCDDEEEFMELDDCDYEPSGDEEQDYDESQDKVFYEPIYWIGYTVSELILPENYYVAAFY